MSKAVLISILPNWVEKICSGEKTIEVRRTRPKIETPFKCYIYCTKQRMTKIPCMYSYLHINEPKASLRYGERITTWGNIGDVIVNRTTPYEYVSYGMQGKVIGEFVCDRIICCQAYYDDSGKKHLTNLFGVDTSKICLSELEIFDYIIGKDKKDGIGWLWHITDLKIYDKPKELGEFVKPCDWNYDCCTCKRAVYELTKAEAKLFYGCDREITRPPQSYCYVEE